MWFAGIDWADRHHDSVVIDEAGCKVGALRVEHTPEGLAKLVAFLRDLAPLEQIACIIETKPGLLITALLEAGLPSIRSTRKPSIGNVPPREPRPIRLMPTCWPSMAARSGQTCGDWTPTVPRWPNLKP